MKMQKHNQTNLLTHATLALALALTIGSPSQVISAEPEKGEKKMHGKMMDKTAPSQSCQAMMEQMKKVMEETKKQDAELATLVAGMNSAPEDKKLDLMAAIVTQMTERQAAMHARKAAMEKKMAQHMMEHMEMGKESMSKCPMMKMKGTDDKTEASTEPKPTAL